MKLLSIIIPVYNVESYIQRCILSLESQDINKNNYEIICINDGSTDNSAQYIKYLKNQYNNIILVNQVNMGVSCARNKGMEIASGKYILFIDPDDFIDENSLNRILDYINYYDAEVSFLGYTFRNCDETIRYHIYNENNKNKIFTGIDAYYIAREYGQVDPDRIWAILFKTQFINKYNLRFVPDIPYLEDGELIARILCLAERCVFDGHSFYQRTTRPGSATNSMLFKSEKATKGALLAVKSLKLFQERYILSNEQKTFLNQPVLKFIKLSIDTSFSYKLNGNLYNTIKMLKSMGITQVQTNKCSKVYRIFGRFYNLSPFCGAWISYLYPRIYRFFY